MLYMYACNHHCVHAHIGPDRPGLEEEEEEERKKEVSEHFRRANVWAAPPSAEYYQCIAQSTSNEL